MKKEIELREELSIDVKEKNFLSDGTKLYEIKRSVPKCELQNIESHNQKNAIIYGDKLGTAKEVIETLETFCHVYYVFLLLNIAVKDTTFFKIILDSDISDFSSFSCFVKNFSNKYVLPSEELIISKINFNSPGFWGVIGELNPLAQMREYINERHKRKKDIKLLESEVLKSELENQRRALENEEYSIEISFKKLVLTKEIYSTLKDMGYSEIELRKFTNYSISALTKLDRCIDDNRITGVEIEEEF